MVLLEVKNLKVYFEILDGTVKAVDDVSFELDTGETLGLVGESGCGKTTTAFAIMRLLPLNAKILGGEVWFKGQLITKADAELETWELKEIEKDMRKIRWKDISIIFQSAMNAFNPVYKVGRQIVEALKLHENITKKEARERAIQLFKLVGLDPGRIDGYPHEFSGGMKQRAMIAMALACKPSIIIADEPTTALDVIMQDRILSEIRELQRKLKLSMIIISHDISVVAETSNRIAIMYAGKIVEYGSTEAIFKKPSNPYTIGLLGAFPNIKGEKRRLEAIPGTPPDLENPPPGCRFHPRCKYAKEICSQQESPMILVEQNHYAACHFASEIFSGQMKEVLDEW